MREIMPSYRENYAYLMEAGLHAKLVGRNMIIPHSKVSDWVIAPDIIPFISYPYEWCFDAYKDAALATLEIQATALDYGMVLKDASAYNIQFYKGKPILIDTTSFVSYQYGEPWIAYQQFCKHFLIPLALMSYCDARMGQLMRIFIDGIPIDLASRLLPKFRMGIGLSTHIFGQSIAQKFISKPRKLTMSKNALVGLVENLRKIISGLEIKKPTNNNWSQYSTNTSYTLEASRAKIRTVLEYLNMAQPETIWDMGAGDGEYSKLGIYVGAKQIIAFDNDPHSVNKCYNLYKNLNTFPLILDISNPSSGIGWANIERMSLSDRSPADVVMALALVHHLAISNNTPLSMIAKWFHSLGEWLIIEFIPKKDPQVEKMLSNRVDVFKEYTLNEFKVAFNKYYELVEERGLPESCRSIYLYRAK